ncbi:MAG: hypothetical protein J6S85_23925 [Methanobrevibacter sp.]|nr:hypothetical protein [Methanobrevibacter sp.]
MIKIISTWVKNPITSYDRDKSLEGHEYQTEQAMCKDLETLSRHGGGLFVKEVESNTHFIRDSKKIVEYTVKCECKYAREEPRYNQAEYHVVITAMKTV